MIVLGFFSQVHFIFFFSRFGSLRQCREQKQLKLIFFIHFLLLTLDITYLVYPACVGNQSFL